MDLDISDSDGSIFTGLVCYREDGEFYSPGRATFGGIWPMQKDVSAESWEAIFRVLISRHGSASKFNFSFPPACFFPEIFEPQRDALDKLGARNLYVETNYHVEVNAWAPQNMSKGNRKKSRQAADAGVSVRLARSTDISRAYAVLVSNRLARGVKMTMSEDDFKKAIETMPNNFLLFVAELKEEFIATALLVILDNGYAYVLYWGDLIEFRYLSPTVFLFESLISYVRTNSLNTLDLGISSNKGILDPGLARFKLNLGALETAKYVKVLVR